MCEPVHVCERVSVRVAGVWEPETHLEGIMPGLSSQGELRLTNTGMGIAGTSRRAVKRTETALWEEPPGALYIWSFTPRAVHLPRETVTCLKVTEL